MFNKIRKEIGRVLSGVSKMVGLGRIQKMLSNKMGSVLNLVLDERRKDADNSNFSPKDTEYIVNGYMKQNIVLATATSFIPGPAGLVASIPSMIATLANQMRCSYDIACAYGKEGIVVKDMLIDIPLQSMGIPTGLANLQYMDDIKEGATDIIAKKLHGLGKVVITKKLNGAMTSMLPGMGTVFAIIQAKLETTKVAITSMSFFDPDQILSELVIDTSITLAQKDEERIKALVNLMTLDSRATDEEIDFISPIIIKSNLSKEIKEKFTLALTDSSTDYVVNYDLLRKSGTSEDLVVDLAVLTKRDGNIGPREIEYVKLVADKLNIHPLIYQKLFEEHIS